MLDGQPIAALPRTRCARCWPTSPSNPTAPIPARRWPRCSGRSGRRAPRCTNLRHALSNLRQILHDADAPCSLTCLISRDAVQFNLASEQSLDVLEFESALAGDDQLEQAAALYRGDFLEGFALKDAPEFEDWALLTRERLRRGYLAACSGWRRVQERRGEHEPAIGGCAAPGGAGARGGGRAAGADAAAGASRPAVGGAGAV